MDARTLAALDRNYRTASAEMFANSDKGASFETRDVHCVSSGYPLVDFNWAFLKRPDSEPASAIERAERYFDERRTPFRFVVRGDLAVGCEALLESRGHQRQSLTNPGMSITPLRDSPAQPTGLRIVPVDSPQTLADFQLAAFGGFGFPAALGARFLTARLLESPESALRVGYVGGEHGGEVEGDSRGEPVATSMLIATGRIAGIYWVATLEAHRRKGYAEALTWAALAAGRSRGCTIGSLQASALGRPVYARMGFEQTAEYVHFQRPAAG